MWVIAVELQFNPCIAEWPVNKGPSSQSYGFSSSHVRMGELDYKKSWAQKNWCFWTVVLEKTLDSPLDCKEIKPVNLKRKSVLNVHWKDWCWGWSSDTNHLMWRADSLEKTLRLGKTESRKRREWEDEMVGWHQRLNGHEFEQVPGDGEGRGAWHTAVHGVTNSQTQLNNNSK